MKDQIEISEIEIISVKPHHGLLCFVSFVFNGALYIGDVALYGRPSGGYRLVYPSKTLPNGCKISCVHPLNKEVGGTIEQAIIEAYYDLMKKSRKSEGENESRSY
ncbi:MAG: SpoVG family protein [Candidatus Omnitrophica bacterium]|nr:SpoVG family protein [Candidatus Omnitrophota bacterium]MBU1134514.1 SpoVG family protein [Candidatus Omnitrophota bacterium]MBU1810831.1 SpoVG family protein [Candidatus Omnitrophota bacterium]